MNFTSNSSAMTHVGHVRSHNEDAFLEKPEAGLWAIADGMGGHEAGDFASQLIINSLDELKINTVDQSVIDQIKSSLYVSNNNLVQLGEKHDRINGSTVITMVLNGNTCDYIWAGDSRLYLLRENKLVQLTKDHSQAELYVELGMLSRDEANNHISANLLTRCIGTDDSLQLDFGSSDLAHGDRFLLSSDGLDKHLSHQEIEQILIAHERDDALNELITMTLEKGGTDNVTVTIVDIMEQ